MGWPRKRVEPTAMADAAVRLAEADAAAQKAAAAVGLAEQGVLDAARYGDAAALEDAVQTLAAARATAAKATEVAGILRRTADHARETQALADLERARVQFQHLEAELLKATKTYREHAAATWAAAQAIERIRETAAELRAGVRPLWSNEIAAKFGHPLPGCDFETPDLNLLRLPQAGPDGELLADPIGVEVEAGAAWQRAVVAARMARADGRREGARIGRAAVSWR